MSVLMFMCFVVLLRLFLLQATVNAQDIFHFVLKLLFHPLISYRTSSCVLYAQDIIYCVLKLLILME